MQISSPLRPFKKPTLVVVTNTQKAKLFLANDWEINEIGIIDTAEDIKQEKNDRENLSDSGSGRNEPCIKKNHLIKDHFYHLLNEDLMRRLQNNEFEALAFTVPEELESELKECLHIQLLKRTTVFVPKNLMKDDLLDILTHIQEAPKE